MKITVLIIAMLGLATVASETASTETDPEWSTLAPLPTRRPLYDDLVRYRMFNNMQKELNKIPPSITYRKDWSKVYISHILMAGMRMTDLQLYIDQVKNDAEAEAELSFMVFAAWKGDFPPLGNCPQSDDSSLIPKG